MADNPTILIVDDDAGARKTFGNILKAKGYDVDSVGNGEEAISKVKGKFFNIVFLDIRLPDISGLEVLKAVAEINEDTVAIMVTAYASVDTSIEAINEAAYSYITKPVDMNHVAQIIARALEKQRLSMDNKRLLVELKDANVKLKEMDARKSVFVANVSHEFKNPLSIIKESLSLVIDGIAGVVNAEQKRILDVGKQNVERLIRLVSDLLDLAKIEAGKLSMRRERFDAGALLQEILRTYENKISEKRLSLKKDIAQDAGPIWADMDKISQVIINLLSNAIKYTPAGGGIMIKLSRIDRDVRLEISDTGSGIAKEDLTRIFDKFERVTIEKHEGTGLGLPITKDIVELHKGRIWVESEAGKGSKFIVTLPIDMRNDRSR